MTTFKSLYICCSCWRCCFWVFFLLFFVVIVANPYITKNIQILIEKTIFSHVLCLLCQIGFTIFILCTFFISFSFLHAYILCRILCPKMYFTIHYSRITAYAYYSDHFFLYNLNLIHMILIFTIFGSLTYIYTYIFFFSSFFSRFSIFWLVHRLPFAWFHNRFSNRSIIIQLKRTHIYRTISIQIIK